MRNNRASMLAVALGAMVFCSMLGMGAMKYGGMQAATMTKSPLSLQAFWAAEAGLERARALVPTFNGTTIYPQPISGADANITTGTYSVSITLPTGQPWSVASTGTKIVGGNSFIRNLHTQIGYQGLTSAISTTGTVTQNGHPTIECKLSENQDAVNFSTIFGMTLADAQAVAESSSSYYDCTVGDTCGNGSNKTIPAFTNKLTYVKLSSNQTLKLAGGWASSGFLIVNGGSLDMSGGGGQSVNFTGIVWVENGSFSSIAGGINITGSIYINGNAQINTNINGSSVDIIYDPNVVNTIMNTYATTKKPKILCWSEVACP